MLANSRGRVCDELKEAYGDVDRDNLSNRLRMRGPVSSADGDSLDALISAAQQAASLLEEIEWLEDNISPSRQGRIMSVRGRLESALRILGEEVINNTSYPKTRAWDRDDPYYGRRQDLSGSGVSGG